MEKYTLTIEFNTFEGWKPLESACWTECPFQCLTRLGQICRAKEAYDKNGLIICPCIRYLKNKGDNH